jgi:predicted dehydrogenase
MSPIHAAIVGLGRWGRRLVDSVQPDGRPAGAGLRFTHAVVRTPERSSDYCAGKGMHLASSYAEVLADPDVQAVVLATPHDQHAEQILAAIGARKHVFVEKPLALTHADAKRAVDAARAASVELAVGHNRRFLPAAEAALESIRSGALGEIVHAEGNFANASGLDYSPSMWRAAESGAQAAMTAMGVHVLDFLVHLCGPVHRVSAFGSSRLMPVDVNGVVSANLQFSSGASGYLSTLLATPRQWRVQVFGTRGWLHMRDEHIMDVCDAKGIVTTTSFGPVDTLRLELEAFARAVAGGAPYPIGDFDLVHVPAGLEAVLASASRGGSAITIAGTSEPQ